MEENTENCQLNQNGISSSSDSETEENNNNINGNLRIQSKTERNRITTLEIHEIDTFKESVKTDKNSNTTMEFLPNGGGDGEVFNSVLVKLSEHTDKKFKINHKKKTRREKLEDLKTRSLSNAGDTLEQNALFLSMLESYEAVLGNDIYEDYQASLDKITGEYNTGTMRRRTLSDYEKEAFMRRDLVLTELSDSEKHYLNDLEFIVNRYLPLMTIENVTEELLNNCDRIYMNIAEIYEFHHNSFHRKIEACFENPDLLDETFSTHEEQLTSLYTIYCSHKPVADESLKIHEEELDKLCKDNFPDVKLRIKDYLIKPVQRLMKYQLLLNSIKKYGLKAGKECTYLDTAINVMERVPKEANDAMHVGLISGYDGSGCNFQQIMLHGELQVAVGKTKPRPMHVFLFESVVLFTEKASKLVPEYKCIDFQDTGTLGYTDSKHLKFVIWFRKHNRTDIYKCQAGTVDEKEQWKQKIEDAVGLKDILNRRKSCRRRLTIEINPPCSETQSSFDKFQTLVIEEAVIKAMAGHPRLGIMTERLKSNIENYIASEFVIPAMELNNTRPSILPRSKTMPTSMMDRRRVTISKASLTLETIPNCTNTNIKYDIKRNITPNRRSLTTKDGAKKSRGKSVC